MWERDSFHSIVGKGGVELRDAWERSRYESYEGISVPGFPNLFYLPGPYSYTGLSYFFTIESQMKHVARCLGEMRRKRALSFEVTQDAKERFMRSMKKDFALRVRGRPLRERQQLLLRPPRRPVPDSPDLHGLCLRASGDLPAERLPLRVTPLFPLSAGRGSGVRVTRAIPCAFFHSSST